MLIIRGVTEEKIHISEIETLIIESTAASLTSALIAELTESGANIIFCNDKHLPAAVFLPVHAHFSTAKKIKEQIAWSDQRKAECWGQIVREKIRQQSLCLLKYGDFDTHSQLVEYQNMVKDGDPDNYEARAASVYFRALFGKNFSRNVACFENDALNYGYTLLMAAFAREISGCGYLTELGIWHRGIENAFNLASDLMEPFRIIVDKTVLGITNDEKKAYKRNMLKFLYSRVRINEENQSLIPAIRIFLHRIFRFMRSDVNTIFSIEILGEEE
jgi:CRISPR-associated endonuclease Cas1 subtype II